MTMMSRHGGTPKVVGGLVIFFGFVYLIYIYNDVSGQLKDTEHTAERYRRESESISAQLSDLTAAKSELKHRCDRCEGDKTEFSNRLSALQQQHKMLKSQHEDMQSEYHKLMKEHDDEAEDHKRINEQQNQEYNQFKQEKVLEVSHLKDQVANYEREKVQLTEQIADLKKRLQESFTQIQTDQQTIGNLQQELLNYRNQVTLDQQTINSLQAQIYNIKNAVAMQQNNMAAAGGAQQGVNIPQQGNLQQQGNIQQQGNFQQGAQLGQQFLQHMQGNRQFMQPAGAQQQVGLGGAQQDGLQQPLGAQKGGVFQQQNQQQVFGQQQQEQSRDTIGGKSFNPLFRGGQLGQIQDSQDVQKDPKQEAERVMKEQELHQIQPPKDTDIHAEEGLGHQKLGQDMIGLKAKHPDEDAKQIAKPNFNVQIPDPDDGQGNDDDHEGAADGEEKHDNRIENQGPVNLQVQEPVLKDHAVADRPIVDDKANLKFRPIMPEDVVQQVQPQIHDDSIKQEQIDHPLVDQQEIKGHNIDDNRNEEKNLGPLENEEEDEDKDDGALEGGAQGRV